MTVYTSGRSETVRLQVSGMGSLNIVEEPLDRFYTKIIKWIYFEVAIAFLSPVFSWGQSWLLGEKFKVRETFGKGELLLISVALVASTLGDLVKSAQGRKRQRTRLMAVGSAILVIMVSVWFYSLVSTPNGGKSVTEFWLVSFTVLVLLSSIAVSVWHLLLGELDATSGR